MSKVDNYSCKKGNNLMVLRFSYFHTLDPDPRVNSLAPKFCSQPIKSLDFGVTLASDPTS